MEKDCCFKGKRKQAEGMWWTSHDRKGLQNSRVLCLHVISKAMGHHVSYRASEAKQHTKSLGRALCGPQISPVTAAKKHKQAATH